RRGCAAAVRAGAGLANGSALLFVLMGGPEMAPHPPPLAGRSSLGLDRFGEQPATAGERNVVPDAPVITTARVDVREADLAGRERDSLMLTAEERRWG